MHSARVGTLRLVDTLPAAVRRAQIAEVERANEAAAALPALTAQSLFAANVANSLECGAAAALPADARRRLVASAVRLGIREFDAHLIIAMVQERARAEGPPPPNAKRRAAGTQRTNTSSSQPTFAAPWLRPAKLLLLAAIIASLMVVAAARWLAGS